MSSTVRMLWDTRVMWLMPLLTSLQEVWMWTGRWSCTKRWLISNMLAVGQHGGAVVSLTARRLLGLIISQPWVLWVLLLLLPTIQMLFCVYVWFFVYKWLASNSWNKLQWPRVGYAVMDNDGLDVHCSSTTCNWSCPPVTTCHFTGTMM